MTRPSLLERCEALQKEMTSAAFKGLHPWPSDDPRYLIVELLEDRTHLQTLLKSAEQLNSLARRAREVVFDDPGDAVRWSEVIK